MNPATKVHRVTTAIAVFFIVVIGVATYVVMQEETLVPLTTADVQAMILAEGHPDNVFNFGNDIEYDYVTTIISIDVGGGQNIYEPLMATQPSPEHRMREWVSTNQEGNTVIFGVLWEAEKAK